MQIGFFRDTYNNSWTRRLHAMAYQYYGMELICFELENVDINREMINGKVFKDGKWINKLVEVPKIINNSPYVKRQYKDVYDFLDEKSYLMFTKYLDKERLNELILSDGQFSHLIIPTINLEGLSSILPFIKKYSNVIIKPNNGSQGKGIYAISQKDELLHVDYDDKTDIFNFKEFKQFLKRIIQSRQYIVQQKIQSKTKFNQPFDIRLQYEKDGKGKWTRIQNYVRIGQNHSIVSNVSKGGSVVRLRPFLKAHFERDWDIHSRRIRELTQGLPAKVEELVNASITSLAFDFGFENGNLYLYEVNYFPGSTFARGEVAMLRAAYTRYLIDNNVIKIKSSRYR